MADKDQIIQKIEENDPNYKIIDLKLVENCFEDEIFLNTLLDRVNRNCYVGNIHWPSNHKQIENNVIIQIENKIKENNWNFERFPNYFIHLLLSSHVYSVSTEDKGKSVISNNSNFCKISKFCSNVLANPNPGSIIKSSIP